MKLSTYIHKWSQMDSFTLGLSKSHLKAPGFFITAQVQFFWRDAVRIPLATLTGSIASDV